MQFVLQHDYVATTLVGQRMGAGEPDEAQRQGWTTLGISVLCMAFMGLPIALLARPLMAFFTGAPEVIRIGIPYLYAVALAEPFMCTAITSGGGLRGAGDTMPGLYYTIVSQWLIRLPAAYVLAFTLRYDVNGLWGALVVSGALQGVLTARKFGKGESRSQNSRPT